MGLRTLARRLTESVDQEAAVAGFVPCSKIEIGEVYMYCPDGCKRGHRVKITGGQYWGTFGMSNHWMWRRVLRNGKLGKQESGYGGAFKYIKKAKKKRRWGSR